MSRFTRIKQSVRIVVIFILTLYFGTTLGLNLPFVQRQLSVLASTELSKLFHTDVSIGNIDVGLLNRFIISDLRLKDQQGKDLLSVERFSAKIDLPELLNHKIRVNSVQLFGLDAKLEKADSASQPNFQFIIDALASKDTVKKETNIDLRINSVLIRNGQIKYDLLSAPETPGKFNTNHLHVNDLYAMVSLKAFTPDSLNAHIRRMNFSEQSGFRLKQLSVGVMANRKMLRTLKFNLELPQSSLKIDSLVATYDDFHQLGTLSDTLMYQSRLQASVVPADLKPFVPALQHFDEPVNLSLQFEGNGQHVTIKEFQVYSPNKEINMDINGLLDAGHPTEEAYFYGRVSKADISASGVSWLLQNLTGKDEVPHILNNIEFVRFQGDVSGYVSQLTLHGDIRSGAGQIVADVTMNKNKETDLRSFSGQIMSDSLKLGKLLGNKELGNTAFNLELSGLKYQNERMTSYIKGNIQSFEFKGYNYQNISLDGEYASGGFNGQLSLEDENGSVQIDGRVLADSPVPIFDLKAVVRNFRPNDLKLTDKYENSAFSLNLNANFTGRNIDDMQGEIDIDSLSLDNPDEDKRYFLENFSVRAEKMGEQDKRLNIRSSFLNANLEGRYSYKMIWPSIRRVLARYIPSLFPPNDKLPESTNNFKFHIDFNNSEFLQKILDIPLQLEMPATLSGYFDDKDQTIDIAGSFPELFYNSSYYESGTLLLKNTEKGLDGTVRITSRGKKGSMFNLSLNTQVRENGLHTDIHWGNDAERTFSGKVSTVTRFSHPDNRALRTEIQLQPSKVIVNDTIWNIHPAHVFIEKDTVDIQNFCFERGDKSLKINGRIGKSLHDSCLVDLQNIDLEYVLDIIQFRAVKFSGSANGKVYLRHVMKEPDILANLNVKSLSLNDALLGDAKIIGTWDNEIGGIRLDADMQKEDKSTRVKGYVSPKMKGLDLDIQAGGTSLAFLQPFISGIFSDVSGEAYGRVRLWGPFSDMDLEGRVKATMGFKVNVLNTWFQASADSVNISSGLFEFRNVQLSDREGHTGIVNGELTHTKLENLFYNFRFNAQNMLVFNTEQETPDFPFYGRIYSSGNITLQGGDNRLTVDGDLRADNRTSFTYVLGATAEAVSNQFITFVDKTPRRPQDLIQTDFFHTRQQENEEEDSTPMDIYINLQIEPTEQARMIVIMDPIAGDNISATGTGNLRMNYYNKGRFQIFGNYVIQEGVYKLSMQHVIRKDFSLRKGGTVSFNGDPRAATLNLQAVYTLNSVSLTDLIETSSAQTARVNCIVNMNGAMTAPELSFDLELPNVSEEEQEMVRNITSTEDQMNTQIIYLLGFGRFYPYDNNTNNTQSSATSSLAFSTLSGQLNNMLAQVINNQNWNLGTNLTTGDNGWTDVSAEAFMSGRLLDNRLILNGNFGYRGGTYNDRGNSFVGDFEAIWLLTRNGEFRLRGYNETNDRYFTRSTLTTQGIGLIYQKDFTEWKELLDWFLHRRRVRTSKKAKEKDTQNQQSSKENTPTEQPVSAVPNAREKRERSHNFITIQ